MTDQDSAPIVDASRETFQELVIDRSSELPVVVDFWAQWCPPCKMLGPVLERLAKEYAGKFLLVKADTDQMPEIADGFGVRGIPAVFGVRDGKVVDSFVGVLPEKNIRTWLDQLLPTPAESRGREALALESTDPTAAEMLYRQALDLDPSFLKAKLGLAALLARLNRAGESRDIINELAKRGFLEPDAERLKAQLDLQDQGEQGSDIPTLRSAVSASPQDRHQRLKLAEALAASGEYAEALDLSLELVERDRKGVGAEAKNVMLRIFQVLPAESELAAEFRRKLSVALS
jgi:putative thioredoxin